MSEILDVISKEIVEVKRSVKTLKMKQESLMSI